MRIDRIHTVAFSPCGTTAATLRAVAAGFGGPVTEHDLTLPGARSSVREFGPRDLVCIGFPVYGGRLPHNAGRVFAAVSGSDTPAVLVAVYGNRDYEDALLEMQREAEKRGFVAIAATAAVAEHCMAPEVAARRPDAQDAAILARFAEAVAAYAGALSAASAARFTAPGEYPYRKEMLRANAAPRAAEGCTRCGTCAKVCPTGAIDAAAPEGADDAACIVCMACIKACPESIRRPTHPTYEKSREWLRATCMRRKEPLFFPEAVIPKE
ncbi:MAG: 4Fe-4S binding protein [Deltaproteobacteria bacterium]|nr:4Fe-4S binding protein [Deltaproteobacteria bacterium]